jgi:RNA polymerase sigma-B factor
VTANQRISAQRSESATSLPPRPVSSTDVERVLRRSSWLVSRAAEAARRTADLKQTLLEQRARRSVLRRERARARYVEPQRDRLVRDNLALARLGATRFTGRGQSFDDLYQVACLGLVKAAERFDPSRGVHFRSYAQAVISGELKRYFRDHGWGLHVARPVQEMFLAVRSAREALTQSLGRAPTVQELAFTVQADEELVIEAIQAGDTFYLQSTDAPVLGDDGPQWDLGAEDTRFHQVEERSWLIPALQTLGERERKILEYRFFEGLSQSQIASRVGISQMHVSRLLARTLATLRAAAEDDGAGARGMPDAG